MDTSNKRIVAIYNGKELRVEPGFCDHRRLEPMTVGTLSYNGNDLDDTTKLVYRCFDCGEVLEEITVEENIPY